MKPKITLEELKQAVKEMGSEEAALLDRLTRDLRSVTKAALENGIDVKTALGGILGWTLGGMIATGCDDEMILRICAQSLALVHEQIAAQAREKGDN